MSELNALKAIIDYRLDAYETIFNHDWAKQINAIVKGTPLDPAAFALSVNWRAAANTHAFPWLMMESLAGLWKGAANDSFAGRFLAAMVKEIPHRMEGKITRIKQRELANEVRALGSRINEAMDQHDETRMSKEEIWQWYLDPSLYEFHVAVWGSQRLVFTSLFHSYENYIRELIAIAVGNPDYKAGGFKELVKDVRTHLGQAIVDDCITHDFLDTTRLIRNALAHNGGKEDEKLRAKQHNIPVEDGILQIMADHNRTLLRALELRTIRLSEAAIKLPQFQLLAPNDSATDG